MFLYKNRWRPGRCAAAAADDGIGIGMGENERASVVGFTKL